MVVVVVVVVAAVGAILVAPREKRSDKREDRFRLRRVHTAECFLLLVVVSLFFMFSSSPFGECAWVINDESPMLHIVGGGKRTAAIVSETKLKLLRHDTSCGGRRSGRGSYFIAPYSF